MLKQIYRWQGDPKCNFTLDSNGKKGEDSETRIGINFNSECITELDICNDNGCSMYSDQQAINITIKGELEFLQIIEAFKNFKKRTPTLKDRFMYFITGDMRYIDTDLFSSQ
jgi:hypothetical protein